MIRACTLLISALLLLVGPVRGDKFLTIERREIVPDKPSPEGCRRCFTTGRAKENLLNLKRDTPYALPKAALSAGVVDTITILAVRVDFTYEDPDDPTTTGLGAFDLRDTATFLAQEGHALDPAPHNQRYFEAHLRALAYYWWVTSNGKLQLVYEVWPRAVDSAYHLNQTIAHYGAQDPSYGLGEFFHDAVGAAYAADGDSISFRDERGKKKAILIFHAGSDRQTDLSFSYTPTPNDLFTGFVTFDAANQVVLGNDTIVEGTIMPETMTQDNRITVMNAVMAHEFGHQLGLIDLYNTGSFPFLTQMGDFALMDNMGMNTAAYIGNYGMGAFGTAPVFPMAWSRAYLGFDDVVEYRRGTSIELAAVKMLTTGTKIVKIPISATEYYLLENRRSDVDGEVGLRQDSMTNVILWPARKAPSGDSTIALREFDLFLPLGSAGIAVWHVDEQVAAMDYFPFDGFSNNFDANTLQWDPKRRFVTLVEADGMIDFGGNYHRGFGSPRDLFFAGNNSMLGSFTNPATIGNDGEYTHINITNVSAPGMIMTFDLDQERLADGFPRRTAIPVDPTLSAVAADLDGNGNDEIVTVSGKRLLAISADGASFIDPDGRWDGDPKNIDTIYSAIQATTDVNTTKPVDTSFAVMPVMADVTGTITTPPVVARFNDTTVVLVGTSGGLIYSFFPNDSAGGSSIDGRAGLFKVRASVSFGAVKAIVVDTLNDIIHGLYAGGQLVSDDWHRSGPVGGMTFDFGGTLVGVCRYRDGMALVHERGDHSILHVTRNVPLAWIADSLVVDSVRVEGRDFHPPIATDFNRDGIDEVALVSRTGQIAVYSISPNGLESYEPLAGMSTGDTAAAGPTAGDFSGDGFPELIIPGTNRVYAYDRTGLMENDFPMVIDYGRPGQVVITRPIISDITGDGRPDIAVTTLDSLLHQRTVDASYVVYPDSINYPDSSIVVDTTLTYYYYNYFSSVYVVSPGETRIEGFPVSAGTYAIRRPGQNIIGAGAALHLKTGSEGLLVTTGADGWLNAWRCGWSDVGSFWPMAGVTSDGGGYLSLEALGEERASAEFVPEARFFSYPNPATGDETRIRFYVNQAATVKITIFDALGDKIWETQQEVASGNSTTDVRWEVKDVASGVYHCRLEATALSGSQSYVAFKAIAVVK